MRRISRRVGALIASVVFMVFAGRRSIARCAVLRQFDYGAISDVYERDPAAEIDVSALRVRCVPGRPSSSLIDAGTAPCSDWRP